MRARLALALALVAVLLAGCGPAEVRLVFVLAGEERDATEFSCMRMVWEAAGGSPRLTGDVLTGEEVAEGVPLLAEVPYRTEGSFLLQGVYYSSSTPYCGIVANVRLRDRDVLTFDLTMQPDAGVCAGLPISPPVGEIVCP